MRIQYEITEGQNKALDKLKRETRLRTKRELLNNALSLFEWAVQEQKNGYTIASLDEKRKKLKK